MSESIHPRVVNGRTVYEKSNTRGAKHPKTIRRAIAGIEKHLERHPSDSVSSRRLAALRKLES